MARPHEAERKRHPPAGLAGAQVTPRISEARLLRCVDGDGDLEDLVAEFVRYGGVVVGADGGHVKVEVESGVLRVPKLFVRRM